MDYGREERNYLKFMYVCNGLIDFNQKLLKERVILRKKFLLGLSEIEKKEKYFGVFFYIFVFQNFLGLEEFKYILVFRSDKM